MADENKFTFQNSSLPKRSYEFFRAVKNDAQLCDVTFHVGDRFISAHRLIIAAAIPYFRNLSFSKVPGSEENKIDMPDVDPAAFESLLDYAYTCEIVITKENMKNLLYGACLLNVEEVREACCNFLIDRLHLENVLSVRNIAIDLKCTDLLEKTDIYVTENFTHISKTEDFLNFSFSYVNQLLSHDELRVVSEEEVFEAVMKWIKKCPGERKKNLPELLKLVRMPLLSPLYLRNHVAKEDLIRSSFSCRDLLDEARDLHYFPEEKSLCSFSTIPRCYLKTSSESSAGKRESIYLIYGRSEYTIKCLENPTKVCSFKLAESLVYGALTAVVNDKLYLFGGSDVISYDPITNSFNNCASMILYANCSSSAEFSGKIYVCGERAGISASAAVQCYDTKYNKWENISRMFERRIFPGIATLGDCIYVSGGFEKIALKSVEKYETRTGKWRHIPPMLCERYGHGLAALNGRLYACGGTTSGRQYTGSAEVYDPVKNNWSSISPMKTARSLFKLLPYCGKLYAFGSANNNYRKLTTVEIYDPKADKWEFGVQIDDLDLLSAEVMVSSPTH